VASSHPPGACPTFTARYQSHLPPAMGEIGKSEGRKATVLFGQETGAHESTFMLRS